MSFSAWTIEEVDAPRMFYVDWQMDIAVDGSNRPHIAYGGAQLYHAYFNGAQWKYEVVDNASSADASIAVDAGGKVHIGYLGNSGLKYATNASGSWVTSTIDSAEGVGRDTSIAVDAGGKVHISYRDYTNDDLKYATNASGSWVTSTIDSAGEVGADTSIAVDAGGKVHISYFDRTYAGLKYATNASGSWVTSTIDSAGDVGAFTSIAVDAGGKVHMSYFDGTNADLKYATNAAGSWVTSTIDSVGNVGYFTSIAVDAGGKVHIGYSGDRVLKYATNAYVKVCSDNVCVELPQDTEPPDLTVTSSPDNPGPEQGDFQVIGTGGDPMYYDISTNPPYSGSMKVCIIYDDTGLSLDQEQSLKIKHWDGSGWNDATCAPPPDNPNTDANIICACVDHLSWFAIGYEVSAGAVTLTLPNGGEVLPSGGIYGICWQASTNAVKFDLSYSINNGTSWNLIKSVTGLHCTHWEEVPVVSANKKQCRVKVIGYDSNGVKIGEDISDKPFKIEVVRVTSPYGGETLKSGSTWAIRWVTNKTIRPVAKTVLKYTTDGITWNPIKTLSGNPGTYNWKVPNATKGKVKVILKDAGGVDIGNDVSDKFSTIQP